MDVVTETSRLRQFIAEQHVTLLRTLRLYVMRAGYPEPDAAARELLNEVVVEALQHEDRFWADGQPMAWLLGIAANMLKRQQVAAARRNWREPSLDDEWFEWVASTTDDPHEDRDMLETWIARLSPDDQKVLHWVIDHGMNGDLLAEALGIKPGAARVRLHRALQRLRMVSDDRS